MAGIFGCQDCKSNFHFSNYTRQYERNIIAPVLTLIESIVLSVSLRYCLSAQCPIDVAAFFFFFFGKWKTTTSKKKKKKKYKTVSPRPLAFEREVRKLFQEVAPVSAACQSFTTSSSESER